jgi:hypothetical protein
MKPNERQVKLVLDIAATILHWQNTNDISSPSHWNLIDEDVDLMGLNEKDSEQLSEHIGSILSIVRRCR